MREILFKAKRKDNGEWVEGYFVKLLKDMCYIIDKDTFSHHLVDENTLCQYTGMTDKNGCRIWENDCIGHRLNVVEFLNGEWCVNGDRSLFFFAKDREVIGNAFDNPEPIKGE